MRRFTLPALFLAAISFSLFGVAQARLDNGGSGSLTQTTADGLYLLLDASNDPINLGTVTGASNINGLDITGQLENGTGEALDIEFIVQNTSDSSSNYFPIDLLTTYSGSGALTSNMPGLTGMRSIISTAGTATTTGATNYLAQGNFVSATTTYWAAYSVLPNNSGASLTTAVGLNLLDDVGGNDANNFYAIDVGSAADWVEQYSMSLNTRIGSDARQIRTVDQQAVTVSGTTTSTLLTLQTTSDYVYTLRTSISAGTIGTAQAAGYELIGTFKNDGGTVTQIGNITESHLVEEDATWYAEYRISGTTVLVDFAAGTGDSVNVNAETEMVGIGSGLTLE